MDLILKVILFLSLVGIIYSSIILVRNFKVFEYRSKMLDRVSNICEKEIESGTGTLEDITRRYDYLRSISYDEMVLKFWKPLKSFYDEEKIK